MRFFLRRISAVLAAAAVLLLASCGSAAQSSGTDADIASQLSLIAENSALWLDGSDIEIYSFAVTDLDHNGRLELISSSCQGSGFFSYNSFWEVNEARDGLEVCKQTPADSDPVPDISFFDAPVCYREADSGRYLYIFTDLLRGGAAEYYESTVALWLENGLVSERLIACKATVYPDGESDPTVTCTDGEGRAISQEAYDSAAETSLAGSESSSVNIGWFTSQSPELSAADGLTELLNDSFLYFRA